MWSSHPSSSRAALVAFWGSSTVSLLELPSLEPYHAADFSSAGEGKLPTSVLLHVFDDDNENNNNGGKEEAEDGKGRLGTPFALVGLADGQLVAYELDKKTFKVKSRRTMVLGSAPLRLSVCRHAGIRRRERGGEGEDDIESTKERKRVVFVSGSRPTVLFLQNGRLQHSPMNLKVCYQSLSTIFDGLRYPPFYDF